MYWLTIQLIERIPIMSFSRDLNHSKDIDFLYGALLLSELVIWIHRLAFIEIYSSSLFTFTLNTKR